MSIRNMLISGKARIVYFGTLLFFSGFLFNRIGEGKSRVWYIAILLNLILLVSTARWIRKNDD